MADRPPRLAQEPCRSYRPRRRWARKGREAARVDEVVAVGKNVAERSANPVRGQRYHSVEDRLRGILVEVLFVDADVAAAMREDTGLFGELPELDSMAVANLITAIEDRFGIVVDDEDVDGEMLETFGGLALFVRRALENG